MLEYLLVKTSNDANRRIAVEKSKEMARHIYSMFNNTKALRGKDPYIQSIDRFLDVDLIEARSFSDFSQFRGFPEDLDSADDGSVRFRFKSMSSDEMYVSFFLRRDKKSYYTPEFEFYELIDQLGFDVEEFNLEA